MNYDRTASEKESERLTKARDELRAISNRLQELVDELSFKPDVVKKFPKQYQSKSNWADFPKAPGICQRASSDVASAARACEMAIAIADAAGE